MKTDNSFLFQNDEVFGNSVVDCETLYRALEKQVEINSEKSLAWCSDVLFSVGFEWI